jgi:hypothetical protein
MRAYGIEKSKGLRSFFHISSHLSAKPTASFLEAKKMLSTVVGSISD